MANLFKVGWYKNILPCKKLFQIFFKKVLHLYIQKL